MVLLAFLSALLLFLSLVAIVISEPQGLKTSFSVHAASHRWSYWLFALMLTVCGTVFDYSILVLGPRVGAPAAYTVAVFLGWVCTILTAWIPDKTGEASLKNPHFVAAYGLAIMMTAIVGALAFAGKLGLPLRVIYGLIACWYLITLYLGLFIRKSRQYFLVFQVINIVSFFMVLLSAAVA